MQVGFFGINNDHYGQTAGRRDLVAALYVVVVVMGVLVLGSGATQE